MEISKDINEYTFSDIDEELNDYEVETGKVAGFDFDALDFEESKKENLKKQEQSSKTEKKSGRVTKKKRVISKVDYEKLVGPDGLAKLKEQGPKLKFMDSKKSKSATIDNLRTIVNFYQTWAHGLCPQMKFKDVIFQSENICKEKRLRRYLDDLREEAKKNDYLTGKTLADNDDEESVFWQTPSQSASRNKRTKRFSSFEDKLKESSGQNHEDLIVIPRLLFTSKDGLEKNSPIKIREEIDTEPFQLIFDKDLEEIIQNSDSPIKRNNILRHRRLVYDGDSDDKDELTQSQEIMLNTGSYLLGSYQGQDDDDDILGDSPDLHVPNGFALPDESRDDILGNNKQASNMDIDQVYEDPTLTSLSPEMNLGSSKRNFLYEDNEVENDDIVDAGSDKENSQPCTVDMPMSKRSTLFFDLGDKYVDLTPIYEEANGGNGL